ncbi:MAG TPA: winged helix-turn-helix domain-containing protein [Solirubrobacterales bacterium]
MSKVFADSLRVQILAELNTREMSPKQFFEEFGGGSISRVSRAFDVLAEYGWLALVRTETGGKRRGAVEHFYRATGPAMFDEATWSDVPDAMKNIFTWRAFLTLADRIKEATLAGTIDAREDRHFTWTPFRLDRQGWRNVIAKVDGLFHWLFEEQKRASARIAESGEEPTPMIVALAAFESPKDTEKQP